MATAENRPAGERSLDATVIDIVVRLVLLGIFAYWSLSLVAPFILIAVWAAVLAVALYPLHGWIKRRLFGSSTLASILITLVGLLILFGPTAYLATSMVASFQALAGGLQSGEFTLPAPSEDIKDWPLVGSYLHALWSSAAANLSQFVLQYKDIFLRLGETLLGSTASLAGSVLTFAASLIVAGFLYGPGEALAKVARRFASRIVAKRGADFIDLAGATTRNVSRGVVGIALLQTILAGAGFLVAGIPAAGLLAFGALLLAIVQIGPGLVIIPTVIWAWSSLDSVTALLFTLYMLPVMLLDNVLKPIVMGKGLKTPMLVIFLGVLGGTLAHGLIGLFLGPIILSVFYELLVAWVREQGEEVGAPKPELPSS